MGNTLIDYKTQLEWKIQLTISISFLSSKDSDETHTMYTKSHNIEIVIGSETDDSRKELFESLLQKYQERLEEEMRRNDFFFFLIVLIHCIRNFIK